MCLSGTGMCLEQIYLFNSEDAIHAICNITLFLTQVMAYIHPISLYPSLPHSLMFLACSISVDTLEMFYFQITYHFFHWKKGTPFAADDQGIYSRLTWWEQIDNGQQLTRNRKFLTVVPVVL